MTHRTYRTDETLNREGKHENESENDNDNDNENEKRNHPEAWKPCRIRTTNR